MAHSACKNSIISWARSALCFSQRTCMLSSSISCSLEADDKISMADSETRAPSLTLSRLRFLSFLLAEEPKSSASSSMGSGSRPSAAMRATSSFLAAVLKASRSCSTTLILSRACSNCSCTPTILYRAVKASCSRAWLRSFSRARHSSLIFAAVRAVLSSSCSFTMDDWALKFSFLARRISFSQSAWVCACVSLTRP